MRQTVVVLLAVVLLAVFATGAMAQQTETQMLRDQVKQLQQQLQQVLDRLQQVESKQAAPAAAPAGPAAPKWSDKLTVNGYFQARYEAREDARDDFGIRRLYVNFVGKLNDRTYGQVTLFRGGIPGEPKVDLDYAFVDYKLSDLWNVRFGQWPNTFGWDDAESSSRRLVLDRFVAAEGLSSRPERPGLRGVWFAGSSDRGVMFTRKGQGSVPTLNFELMNGNFRESDNNNDKTYEVDARFTQPWGIFGASYINGDYTSVNPDGTLGAETPRRALGLYLHTDPTPWGVQGEYIDGELFGHDIRGWYGQAAHCVGKGTQFARYEWFDPQRDVSGDAYKALHLGYMYQLDANNRLTLEWINADRKPAPLTPEIDYGQLGLQWQMGF